MTPIQWTETARADLRALHAYIARDSQHYAGRTVERIRRAANRLRRFPGSGTKVLEWDRDDLREVLVGSYRIIYQWDDRRVRILTVIHAARQLPGDGTSAGF